MSERVIVYRDCDIHEAQGETEEARWVPMNIDGSGEVEVLMCEKCISELVQPLLMVMEEYGDHTRMPATPRRRSNRGRKPTAGGWICEHKDCLALGAEGYDGPSKSALTSHLRRIHDITYTEMKKQAARRRR